MDNRENTKDTTDPRAPNRPWDSDDRRGPTRAWADNWSTERCIDAGDSHVKGEPSLCVGEAA